MITVNDQQYEFVESMTIAGLLDFIKIQQVMSTSALLVRVNDEVISPAAVHQVFINDGDILKIRNLPMGG
ncbi:MAG: hypothetical protein JJE18_06675 [Eubacteriaceae bacterium]|nr:hypothetical protein [Eubacteriaceae bacterium]